MSEMAALPYICRHGRYRSEHWCDDHNDHAADTNPAAPVKPRAQQGGSEGDE